MGDKNFNVNFDARAICVIYDEAKDKAIGTGFVFLKPDWVVTAKHVVLQDDLPREELTLLFLEKLKIEVSAKVYIAHPVLDLAVLKIVGQSPCRIPFFPSYERYSGNRGLIYLGYSPSMSKNINQGIHSVVVGHTRIYERVQYEREDVEDLICFEASHIEGGYSGGPLLGEGGGVVGVFIHKVSNEGRATSIHPLLKALEFRSDWSKI